MTKLGYMPMKVLLSTSVYSLGAIGGIKALLQGLVKGEVGDLTTLVYDAREQVFDRIQREALALGAQEVVGIKTYIVELGPSLVEIFSVGTAVRHHELGTIALALLMLESVDSRRAASRERKAALSSALRSAG